MRRVVVTGGGAVCASGVSVDEVWDRVLEGESGIGEITSWDTTGWPVSIAGEAKQLDNSQLVADRKLHKMISRTDLLGLYAADKAVADSGFLDVREGLSDPDKIAFNDRSGVFAGSGGGTYQSQYDFIGLIQATGDDMEAFGREAGSHVSPMWLLRNLPNNVVCHVGIRYGLKGVNACVTNQCTSGPLALADAVAAIQEDEADRAVVAAHDVPVEPEMVLSFHRLGLLSKEALRPFDADRSGTVLAEGAAAMVLEAEGDARQRGAKIRGEILGFGCVTEGTGILAIRPDGDGVERAIRLALKQAEVNPEDIGFVVTHGNGSRASDASEALALYRVFGPGIPITAFKGSFGHTLASSGLLDALLAMKCLETGRVPAILGLRTADAALPNLGWATEETKPRYGDLALTICRGFGGMNTALVLRGP